MSNKEIEANVAPQINNEGLTVDLELRMIEHDEKSNISLAIQDVVFRIKTATGEVAKIMTDTSLGVAIIKGVKLSNDKDWASIELIANDGEDEIKKTIMMHVAGIRTQAAEAATIANTQKALPEKPAAQKALQEKTAAQKAEELRLAKARIKQVTANITNSIDAEKVAFKTYAMHASHPQTRASLIELAETKPEIVIRNLQEYIDLPLMPELLGIIASKRATLITQSIEVFINKPWAGAVMTKVAESEPKSIFQIIETYEFQPWAIDVVRIATERAPETAQKYYELYKLQPWASEVWYLAQSIIDKKAKEEQESEDAMHLGVDFFKNIKKYKDKPWAKKVALRAIQTNCGTAEEAFKCISSYKDEPWAGEVALHAARYGGAETAIEQILEYSENQFARDVAVEAAQKLIKTSFYYTYIDNLKRIEWGGRIIAILRENKCYQLKWNGKFNDSIPL